MMVQSRTILQEAIDRLLDIQVLNLADPDWASYPRQTHIMAVFNAIDRAIIHLEHAASLVSYSPINENNGHNPKD